MTNLDYLPILGQLGLTQEAAEKWKIMLARKPDWTAASFENWYRMWNFRDDDRAKLIEGIYKTGIFSAAAKPSRQ